MNDNEKPLGQRIRDLINPALEDSRRESIQADILNKAFGHACFMLPQVLEHEFSEVFNEAARVSHKEPDKKNPFLIDALTARTAQGEEKYSPTKRMQLSISLAFTTFTAEEVKELPNYIRLHELARDMDVAIRVYGLLAEEKGGSPYNNPPVLILDASKTYEEGAMENANFYPNLPPKQVPFDKKAANEFKF